MNRVALFGYGTVGRGVKELLKKVPGVSLAAVFDKPEKKDELQGLLVTDKDQIINDKSIDTVIECMGGDELPYQVISSSLVHHKNVISSNKETISKHLKEYIGLANKNGVSIQFEASVGGGMPLIYPLSVQSQFDEISLIRGILNGTSDFILSKMQDEQMDFKEAVELAIEKGFAEKDPSADLLGLDMVRKGSILSSLVSRREIHNEDILNFGIQNISKGILTYFKKQNRVIKLITEISFAPYELHAMVLPAAVSATDPLAGVKNENNGVSVIGKYNDPLFLSGKGAGMYPTASAIIQDLIRVIHNSAFIYEPLGSYLKAEPDLKGQFIGFNEDNKPVRMENPDISLLKSYKFIAKME